ncbi:MAG: hypothetical protein WC872_00795 [Candidatus Absconditabacterales bacterium]
MVIRDLKKHGSKKILLIISCVFIILFLISVIKVFNKGTYNQTNLTIKGNEVIGDLIKIKGTLINESKFPNYTHVIFDLNGKKIGLKSSVINLNNYSGEIEIIGRLENYLKTTPILQVDTIKLLKQGIIIKDERFFFVKDFLYLDFQGQKQIEVNRSGENIMLFFNKTPFVDIQRFLCSRIFKGKNCNYIIEDYIKSKKDNFESIFGYKFYKHGTGLWILFDGGLFGYIFKNVDDETMLDISNYINIANKDFVLANKIDIIKSECKNQNEKLISIDDMKTIDQGHYLLNIIINGKSNIDNDVTCKITFDLRNERNTKNIEFTEKEKIN